MHNPLSQYSDSDCNTDHLFSENLCNVPGNDPPLSEDAPSSPVYSPVHVTSILGKSTWKNIQIIVIENNSEREETFRYYEELENRYPQVKVVTWNGPFNYSAINNFGAKYADGDYFLLLNNDTEVITPEWLENMIGYCKREDVGIVGAKLLYPEIRSSMLVLW